MEILNVQNLYPVIKARPHRVRTIYDIKEIMIHHTGSNRLLLHELYKLHTETLHNWSTIGYHYYITKNCIIYQINDLRTITNGCENRNKNTIHICFEGNYEQDMLLNKHKECLVYIIDTLLKYKLRLSLTYHSKHKKTLCPGANMIKYIDELIEKNNKQSFLIWPELE